MRTLREWLHRLLGTMRRGRRDNDLEEELRLHLELATEAAAWRGESPKEARRQALIRSGGPTQAIENLRDQRSLPWLADLANDIRYTLRSARREPLLAGAIVLSLALGLGANATLFSVTEAAVMRDLPVDAPEELVYFRWQSREWFPDMDRFAGFGSVSGYGRRSPTFTSALFETLQTQANTLSHVFAFNHITPASATIDHQALGTTMQLVSGQYFDGLRVRSAVGRMLVEADDDPAAEPAVVVSYRFWERRFRQDPSAIGTPVILDGVPFTIVGVAPETFRGATSPSGTFNAQRSDFWVPLSFAARFGLRHAEDHAWWLSVMGRMRPDVVIEQVQGNLAGAFQAALRDTELPPSDDVANLHVLSARRGTMELSSGPEDKFALLGLVFGTLLLLACLNVANLLLLRAVARRAEIGVRLALGASRARLIRQLLTESLTLALAGGLLGLLLAWWSLGLIGVSTLVPWDLDLRIDASVFSATALLAMLTGLAFGIVPALRATRMGTSERVTIRGTSLLNRSVLATQVAVSVVLLVGAGLFVRTLGHWSTIDTGFDARDLLVFQITPETIGYDAAQSAALRDQLASRIRAVPGVLGATTSGSFWQERYVGLFIDGQRQPRSHSTSPPRWMPVRHTYFETLKIPLVTGRGFLPGEDDGPPTVAVVDEHFARRYFDGANPIGHRIAFDAAGREMEIVGVVGATSMPDETRFVRESDGLTPAIYLPERTRGADFFPDAAARNALYRDRAPDYASVIVRTSGDPLSLVSTIRAAIIEVEPNLPMLDVKTVTQGMRERLEPMRLLSFICLTFGGMALLLTAIGLYGLLGYTVARRTREIGIRTALGARQPDIVRLVTRQTAWLMAIGLTTGVAATVIVTQLVRGSIYIAGVEFSDPLILVVVVVVLTGVASLAAFAPTRKALRVDPTTALRAE